MQKGLATLWRWMAWLLALPCRLVWGWAQDAWDAFRRKGYLLIVTLIAAYVGLYSVMEARHERQANRALFERANFITMVASGNRGTFIAAMKTFGPVQRMVVPRDPELLAPWTWFELEKPNETPLHLWARSFFPLCAAEICGGHNLTPTTRIDLTNADLARVRLIEIHLAKASLRLANLTGAHLTGADLGWVDLTEAELGWAHLTGAVLTEAHLGWAHLTGAVLTEAHLTEADLTGAVLTGADLTGAVLTGANLFAADLTEARLHRANLRSVTSLTQRQLNTACVDDATELPDALMRPTPCKSLR